jgi:hypothetical protein
VRNRSTNREQQTARVGALSLPASSAARHIARRRTLATPESAGPLPRARGGAQRASTTRAEASVKHTQRTYLVYTTHKYNSRGVQNNSRGSVRTLPIRELHSPRVVGPTIRHLQRRLSTSTDNKHRTKTFRHNPE